jgi:hypothetical protein
MNTKDHVTLITVSLLAMLFTSFHHVDDVVRGMAPSGLTNLVPVVFLLVWLYGTLVLAERRSGYVIILVASILASGLPIVHMVGSGLAGKRIGSPNGAFFFAWTLIALGVTAAFSVILSARGLWSLRRDRARSSNS